MFENLITRKIGKKIFFVFLLFYAIVAAIDYYIIGLHAVYWHTHIMVYVYVFLFVYFFLKKILLRKNTPLFYKIWTYFKIIGTSFLMMEVIIMLFLKDIDSNHRYPAFYETKQVHPYHTWTQDHWLESSEFKHYRTINSELFPDTEWKVEKEDGTTRVLCVGDSFTEGAGAHVDSSYVSFLRRELQKKYSKVEVMNAGSSGSDPFFYFANLKDRLLKYQPDIVVFTLSSNDINWDIKIRGGMERFQSKGKLKYKSVPWWEPIYALSYVSRILFRAIGYNQILQIPSILEDEKDREKLLELFKQTNNLAQNNNITMLLAFFPLNYELKKGKIECDFNEIKKPIIELKLLKIIDLNIIYKKYMKENKLTVSEVYWEKDGHHNAKGYEMMAKSILPDVQRAIDSIRNINYDY